MFSSEVTLSEFSTNIFLWLLGCYVSPFPIIGSDEFL